MLMRGLPPQIFKHLATVNSANKTNAELRTIILNARKNVEIWQVTAKNFGIINPPSKSSGRISETGSDQNIISFRKPFMFSKNQKKT
jgi:hypothetical protein